MSSRYIHFHNKLGSNRWKKLLQGLSIATVQNGVRTLIGLITIPIALGYLNNERYGLWMVSQSTLTIISFMDAGVFPVIKNKMSEAFGRSDKEKFQYYSSGNILIAIIVFIIGLLPLIFIPLFNWIQIFNVQDPIAMSEALPTVIAIYIVGLSNLSLSAIDGIYAAQMQIVQTKIVDIIFSPISLLLLLLAIKIRASLPLLIILISLPLILSKFILLYLLYKSNKELIKINIKNLPHLLKETIPTSISYIGIKVSEVALSTMPNIMIVRFVGLSNVAIFSVAYRLTSIPLNFISAILPVLWPVYTIAWVRKELVSLRYKLRVSTIILCIGLLSYEVIIYLWGGSITFLWTGGALRPKQPLLMGMGLWAVMQGMIYWLSTFLHSISDFRFEMIIFFITTCCAWILLLLITPNLGLVGITLSMSIALFCASLIPLIVRINKWLIV